MLFNNPAGRFTCKYPRPSFRILYHSVIHFIKHLTEEVFYKDTVSKLKMRYKAHYIICISIVDTIILKHWMEQNIKSEGSVFLSTNHKSTELLQPHLKYFTKVPKILISNYVVNKKSQTGKINISYIQLTQSFLRIRMHALNRLGCINLQNLCGHHQEEVPRFPKHPQLAKFGWFLAKLWQFQKSNVLR